MCFLSYCRSQPPARLISGEEHFSSKKCLAWFYEYAGNEINIRRYQSRALQSVLVHSFNKLFIAGLLCVSAVTWDQGQD